MEEIQIRKINGKRQIQDIVGTSYEYNGIPILIVEYNEEFSELTISIDGNMNGYYKSEEKISLAFGEENFFKRLELNYGLKISELNTFAWSLPTADSVRTLMNAGFENIIINGENIYMENSGRIRVPATFFTEEERNYLIHSPKMQKLNTEEKRLPMSEIYYK